MPSRRDQIKLTDDELAQLFDEERVIVATSMGPRGWPHSMPLWFIVREREAERNANTGMRHEVWIWTFAKSQKVKNLERDPKATLLIEAGEEYTELRGAMIEAEAEIIRDPEVIAQFGIDLTIRYSDGIDSIEGDAAEAMKAQAAKRVAIRFKPVRTATWDHRKLGGTY